MSHPPPSRTDSDAGRRRDGASRSRAIAAALAGLLVVLGAVGLATGVLRLDDGGLSLPSPPRLGPATRFPLRALHPVVLAWAGLLVATAPRARAAWLGGAAALVLRLASSRDTILMGVDYAYVRLTDATGLAYTGKLYGPTWGALQGLVAYASGGWPGHVGATDLLLSTLTVVLGAAIADRAFGSSAGAWTAAVLVVLPLPVALARTETELVLATALQAAGVYGLLRRDGRGGWLVATSAVLLADLRPDALPVALGLGVALALHRRVLPATVAVAAVAHRLGVLATGFSAGALARPVGATAGGAWLRPETWVGRGGTIAVLDPWVTPALLAPLAVLGLTRLRRRALPFAALAVVTTLPYVHLERPTDVLRFALPGELWCGVLAGAALAGLPRAWAAALGAGLAISLVVAARPLGTPFPWQLEDALVRTALQVAPPDHRVRYHAPWDRTGAFALWLEQQAPGRWSPLEHGEVPAPGDLYLEGRADRTVGATSRRPASCTERVASVGGPIRVTDVEPLVTEPFEVTLWRCGPP